MKLWIWRRSPGRELHETTVRKNAIGETVLPDLTETFAIFAVRTYRCDPH
jgi:hypothetical protein